MQQHIARHSKAKFKHFKNGFIVLWNLNGVRLKGPKRRFKTTQKVSKKRQIFFVKLLARIIVVVQAFGHDFKISSRVKTDTLFPGKVFAEISIFRQISQLSPFQTDMYLKTSELLTLPWFVQWAYFTFIESLGVLYIVEYEIVVT